MIEKTTSDYEENKILLHFRFSKVTDFEFFF